MTVVAAVLQVLLGLVFLASGGTKLAGTRQQVADYGRYHYPSGTRQLTGAVEVVAAVGMFAGLAYAPFAVAAGALIVVDMLFAVYTHVVRVGDPTPRLVAPLLLATLALVVVAIRI